MSKQFAFKFGKHKGRPVDEVVDTDYYYCEWLIHQKDFETKNQDLFNFLIKHGVKYDKDFNKKKEEKREFKKEHFTFGKYKNQEIVEVFNKDPEYCNYIHQLENVRKYHKQTVDTIEELIMTDC